MHNSIPATDSCQPKIPQPPSFPRQREATAGDGDGFPSPRERRAHPQSSFPQQREPTAPNRHSRHGGPRRTQIVIPATAATAQIVIPAQAGIHGGGPAMGSRLHGNDGRNPQSSFPPRRESTAQIVIPAQAGIHGGGPAMGSRLHGNDGRRRAQPTIVIPAQAGIHGGGPAMGSRLHGNDGRNPQSSFPPRRESTAGAGDGFPSPRERRAQPTIVIPATARIHGGGPAAMGSRLHGNDGRNPQSSFPPRRESTAQHRHSRAGGNPRRRGGPAAMGSRLHGNDGRNPQSSFPPRRESTAQHRHSRAGGNPRRRGGAGGDGFPSPRERRAHPQSSFPPRRESTAGGRRRWVPVSTGTTGATHNRHSRHGGNPRRGGPAAMGSRLHGNDGRRRAHPQSSFPPRRGHTSSFPRRRESTAGRAAMGSRLHGNDGRTHNRHSRHGANPRPHIVIPAQAAGTTGTTAARRVLASSLIEWRRSGAAR